MFCCPAFMRPYMTPTVIQFLKFGLVGGGGFVVDTLFLYIGIYLLGLERVPAGFFAFPFAVTATWIGNRLYTFSDQKHEPMAKQWSKFAMVCAVGIVFNRGMYSLLVSTIDFVYDYPVIALFAGSLTGMFFNFFASRKIVFNLDKGFIHTDNQQNLCHSCESRNPEPQETTTNSRPPGSQPPLG